MKFVLLESRGGNYLVVAQNIAWLRTGENGQTNVGMVGGSPLLVTGTIEEVAAKILAGTGPEETLAQGEAIVEAPDPIKKVGAQPNSDHAQSEAAPIAHEPALPEPAASEPANSQAHEPRATELELAEPHAAEPEPSEPNLSGLPKASAQVIETPPLPQPRQESTDITPAPHPRRTQPHPRPDRAEALPLAQRVARASRSQVQAGSQRFMGALD